MLASGRNWMPSSQYGPGVARLQTRSRVLVSLRIFLGDFLAGAKVVYGLNLYGGHNDPGVSPFLGRNFTSCS